ncbi:MAG: WecB/TagA/CpsF family glycosyltransferase [Pseudoflavonifractor sp.]|nr:WecB/TagA/CpsF family glycosyltransferase [Pseudoflavonifractor sp.]
MKTDILGVNIDDLTPEEAVAAGSSLIEKEGFHYAVTPNPEFILTAKQDEQFRAVLNSADLALADGIGVVYAAKILGRPLKGKVSGIDFAQGLLASMAQTGRTIFLLGAKPGVADRAAENLRTAHPGLIICGTHDGYFQDDTPVVEEIRATKADVIFVCLGAPKQELWMVQHGPDTGARLAVGLGGSLDVFAGTVERAPDAWQKAGMEWLYRLIKEPNRFGRMARLPLILVDALATRLGREQA